MNNQPNAEELLKEAEGLIPKIKLYHSRKIKHAFNSAGDQDPYLTARVVAKKFSITPDIAEVLISEILKQGGRNAEYIELGFK